MPGMGELFSFRAGESRKAALRGRVVCVGVGMLEALVGEGDLGEWLLCRITRWGVLSSLTGVFQAGELVADV